MECRPVTSWPRESFWAKEKSAKVKLEDGSILQIGRYNRSRWKRNRPTIKFRRQGTFGNRGRGRKLDNENACRKLQCGSFDYRSILKKLKEIWKLALTNSPTTTKLNVLEFSMMCCRETRKLHFWRISLLGINRGFSLKPQKKEGFRFTRCFSKAFILSLKPLQTIKISVKLARHQSLRRHG